MLSPNPRDLFDRYGIAHPDELPRLALLREFFGTHSEQQWSNRSTQAGHLTASGVVVDRARSRVLLVHHNALDRWLQPGGHIEPTDASLLDAAIREVVEETGLAASELKPIGRRTQDGQLLPVDIDSHAIPARPSKGEGPHTHHDFRFAFEYTGDQAFTLQAEEVHDARWCPIDALPQPNDIGDMIRKTRIL
ncbi:MAG: NUDIX hydrolase [Tepidisphaeraceae bacterium]